MKKFLVLITLMVAIFGFSAGAFAAFGDPICLSCKGTLRNVPLSTIATQGSSSCTGFDYDLNSAADGYCVYSALNNYRAIFAVCNCELSQAAKLIPGFRVAIRMQILVNGQAGALGAYWSGTGAVAAMNFQSFATQAAACAALPATRVKSFGAPTYYLSDGSTSVPVLIADPTCTVPAAQKATILRTAFGAGQGYLIDATDVNMPYWYLDIPPIRIDPAAFVGNELISVKISLFDATQTPVCPDCIVPICECTIDVARVGCSASVSTTLMFPYFSSLTAGEYFNGIVIGNPNSTAGSCTLTAYEKDGSTGTATVAVPAKGQFVDVLENLTFTGTGLGGVPCYISASCNYGSAFGFAQIFSTATGVSAGYKVP